MFTMDQKNADIADDIIISDNNGGAVYRKNNRIHLNGAITAQSCSAIILALEDAQDECNALKRVYSLPAAPCIELHIQSFGGELLPSLAVIDAVMSSSIEICSTINGFAASAATLISVSCHKRYAHAHSVALLHQLSGGTSGKASAMVDELDNVKTFMNIIKDIYCTRTKISKNEIDSLLLHDLWFDAKTMLNKGIIDGIV